ncbi:6468_t:CDS:1, partial [Dentiscutata heterogama]
VGLFHLAVLGSNKTGPNISISKVWLVWSQRLTILMYIVYHFSLHYQKIKFVQ